MSPKNDDLVGANTDMKIIVFSLIVVSQLCRALVAELLNIF